MANEVAVSGKSEAEINAFLDKITTAMVNIVKSGLAGAVDHAARADQAEDQGRRRLQARHGRQVRGAARRRRRVGLRAGRLGGERARPPGRHGADRRLGRRDARARVRAGRGRPQAAAGRRSATACWRRRRSATCASTTRRCPAPRAAARRRSAWRRRWARRSSRRRTTSSTRWSPTPPSRRCEHHLGMTCDPVAGFVQVPVHRALRVRRRQGVDRLHDREQRDPRQPPRRLRHDGRARWRSRPRR